MIAMILKLFTFTCVCYAIANAQTKSERLDPTSTLVTGHGTSEVQMGIITNLSPENRAKLRACDAELDRLQNYRRDFAPLSVRSIATLYKRFEKRMINALSADPRLDFMMRNFTAYMDFQLNYRGPVEDPEFSNCEDMCPDYIDSVGVVRVPGAGPCFVIHPQNQNLQFKQCKGTLADPRVIHDQNIPSIRGYLNRIACVHDSFVDKAVVVFCPKSLTRQCRDITVRLPTSCSPKFAKCMPRRIFRRPSAKGLPPKNTKKRNSLVPKYLKS